MPRQRYISALGYRWLNRLYDPLIRWTMPERRFKTRLIQYARIEAHDRILDLGCGTGTLMLLMQKRAPNAGVNGVDGDLDILRIATSKAASENLRLKVTAGMASALPYRDGCFDRVLTTLVLHHLNRENKRRALGEAYRVLRLGGELHIADWGEPHNLRMRVASLLVSMLDSLETTSDNVHGLIPELCRQAGFENVSETDRFSTLFGTLSMYSGTKGI
jgi:SAM-dependent methyltransferase